jgi:CheY-like chemotaxis protein
MADDDPDDRMLTQQAFREHNLPHELRFVEDGEQLLDYLRQQGKYNDVERSPRPALVLLDLNMPRKDGREALAEIKSDPDLRRIPVVVLTTSRAEQDVLHTYELGANSYIAKPVSFDDLANIVKAVGHYWGQIVQLPS